MSCPPPHLPAAIGPLGRKKTACTNWTFCSAGEEDAQRSAEEEARFEGGALAAEAVGRDAPAVEGGAAAEQASEEASELGLRKRGGEPEEENEGEPACAHLAARVRRGEVGPQKCR